MLCQWWMGLSVSYLLHQGVVYKWRHAPRGFVTKGEGSKYCDGAKVLILILQLGSWPAVEGRAEGGLQ
jgi:hypothetical protein